MGCSGSKDDVDGSSRSSSLVIDEVEPTIPTEIAEVVPENNRETRTITFKSPADDRECHVILRRSDYSRDSVVIRIYHSNIIPFATLHQSSLTWPLRSVASNNAARWFLYDHVMPSAMFFEAFPLEAEETSNFEIRRYQVEVVTRIVNQIYQFYKDELQLEINRLEVRRGQFGDDTEPLTLKYDVISATGVIAEEQTFELSHRVSRLVAQNGCYNLFEVQGSGSGEVLHSSLLVGGQEKRFTLDLRDDADNDGVDSVAYHSDYHVAIKRKYDSKSAVVLNVHHADHLPFDQLQLLAVTWPLRPVVVHPTVGGSDPSLAPSVVYIYDHAIPTALFKEAFHETTSNSKRLRLRILNRASEQISLFYDDEVYIDPGESVFVPGKKSGFPAAEPVVVDPDTSSSGTIPPVTLTLLIHAELSRSKEFRLEHSCGYLLSNIDGITCSIPMRSVTPVVVMKKKDIAAPSDINNSKKSPIRIGGSAPTAVPMHNTSPKILDASISANQTISIKSSAALSSSPSSVLPATQVSAISILRPPMLKNWLQKQGHIVKNWKRRYFVLDSGYLRYFSEELATVPYGKDTKGTLLLQNCEVYSLLALYDEELAMQQQQQQLPPGEIFSAKSALLRRASTVSSLAIDPATQSNGRNVLSDRTVIQHRVLITNASVFGHDESGFGDEIEGQIHELVFDAPDAKTRDIWIGALNAHINYINTMATRIQCLSSDIYDNDLEFLAETNKLRFAIFLKKGEKILFTSMVNKPNPMGMASYRQAILTTGKRLIYVEPNTMEYKGQIDLSQHSSEAIKVDESTFQIKSESAKKT